VRRGVLLRVLVFVLLCVLAPSAWAHEIRPAYLALKQTATDRYDVLWKVPGNGDARLGIYVRLPGGTTNVSEPTWVFVDNAYVQRWSVWHSGGLNGDTIRVDGLDATAIDVLVRVERLDGTTQTARLTPASPAFVIEATPRSRQVAVTYLRLGIEHILSGVDHLLFILALLILVKGVRRLIATVTAFTLAHSLTLAGATLGIVHVPGRPVEAAIALSIAFVAAEIVHSRRGTSGLTEKYPWVVAFTFGLLHGFGFASALAEVGLPRSAIPVALFFFNVGVEIGQLLFIAAVFAVIALGRDMVRRVAPAGLPPRWSTVLRALPPYAIGSAAMYWVVQRIAAF